MRRIGLPGAAGALLLLPFGSSERPLPLHSPQAVTPTLTALLGDARGSRLARVNPSTFATLRTSPRVGFYDGWVRSPNGAQLAIATHPYWSGDRPSTLHFVSPVTLRWVKQGVPLNGAFRAALWPTPGTILALTDRACCTLDLTLATVDTAAKKVVALQTVEGPAIAIGRANDALVLLGYRQGEIGPARLTVVGADASLRSVLIDRIVAGTVWPEDASSDPIGTQQRPGLAVDAAGGVAYVIGGDGLVAAVDLHDLAVSYHHPAPSVAARLSEWLTPGAQAKGVNGPLRRAQWLGDGLIAVAGSDDSAVRQQNGTVAYASQPAGLQVIDTLDWSARTVDAAADTATVAEGVLLATGGTWKSEGSTSTEAGEGLAAYNADGSLLWRLGAGARRWVLGAYQSRAMVQTGSGNGYEVVDLATGRVLRTVAGDWFPSLLLGAGS